MHRIPVPNDTQVQIEIKSKRRCALCYGLYNDLTVKHGQIAHLDGNNSNNILDNLCFLCIDHHNLYDAKFLQSKNYNINEVKHYRNELYLINEGKKVPSILNRNEIENFLNILNPIIIYLNTTDLDLGYMIHCEFITMIESLLNYWSGFKMTIQTRQLIDFADKLLFSLSKIYSVFDDNYVSNSFVLTFKWTGKTEHDDDLLQEKKSIINNSIRIINNEFNKIKQLIS